MPADGEPHPTNPNLIYDADRRGYVPRQSGQAPGTLPGPPSQGSDFPAGTYAEEPGIYVDEDGNYIEVFADGSGSFVDAPAPSPEGPSAGPGGRSGGGSGGSSGRRTGAAASAPSPPVSVAGVQPIGHGYIEVRYSDGSSEVMADQGASYISEVRQIAPGLYGLVDQNGRIFQTTADPSYTNPESVRQYNETLAESRRATNLDYNAGVRGQDIDRELDLRQLAKSYLDTATSITDPYRQAAYILGVRGGVTPVEGALRTFRESILPEIRAVPAVQPLPITATAAKGIGPVTNENILVGEEGRPEIVSVRGGRFQGVTPARPGGPARSFAPGSTPAEVRNRGRQPGPLKGQPRPAATGQYPVPERQPDPRRARRYSGGIDALRLQRKASAARARGETALAEQFEAEAELALGRGAGTLEAQAYDTTGDLLFQSIYGQAPLAGDAAAYDLLSDRPRVFGVTLQDPDQLAYRFGTLPPDIQDLILSHYAGGGAMSANEFLRKIRDVTPVGLAAGTRFGYRG
jgi:hypothetical protein